MTQLSAALAAKRNRNHSAKIDRYIREGRTVSGGAASGSGMTPQQANALQRAMVLNVAQEMTQPIFSQVIAAPTAGNNTLNIPLKAVGLLKKLIIEVSGTYTSTGAAAATAFGLANLLSNVTLLDLSNNTRINTNGIHLSLLKQFKHKGSDFSSTPVTTAQSDAMIAGEFAAGGAAPNFPVITYPLPSTAAAAFRGVFEVPVCYSDDDLRGAIYLNVVNATAYLQLTINPTPSPATADNTFSVWGTATGPITNVTVTVYQVFLDQLPMGAEGVILPLLDLSTVYELKATTLTGIVAAQDFPIAYANFRDFLSVMAIFNSTGATAGLKNGADVNYWSLQSANFTNIFKRDPLLQAQLAREILSFDLPLGTYYFSHRRKPINTQQYGNMQLNLNAAAVAGVPYVTIGWEDFASVNAVTQAGSLA